MKRIRYTATDIFKKRKVMQLLFQMEYPELRADEVIDDFFNYNFLWKPHKRAYKPKINPMTLFREQLFPGLSMNKWQVLKYEYQNKITERDESNYQRDMISRKRLLPLPTLTYRKLSEQNPKWFRVVEGVYEKAYSRNRV